MKDTKLGNELARYAAINKHLLAFNNETTLDVNYDSFIREMRNTSWDGPASDGGVCVCVCTCVCAYVCACVGACLRASVHVHVCMYILCDSVT